MILLFLTCFVSERGLFGVYVFIIVTIVHEGSNRRFFFFLCVSFVCL